MMLSSIIFKDGRETLIKTIKNHRNFFRSDEIEINILKKRLLKIDENRRKNLLFQK